MSLVKQGGFSSCCVFHRRLGSDDEAAGLQERAERLLYFYPRDLPLPSQLKHVGFCEGLIDFMRTFAGPFVSQTLALHKRKYVFLQVEPDVWMVVVLVNAQIAPPAPTAYPRTTDTTAALGTASALHAATSRRAAVSAAGTATVTETYANDASSDAVVYALLRRIYDWHALFYGSISRILCHPDASRAVARLLELRQDLRKLVDKREALVSNYESLLRRAAEENAAAAAARDGGAVAASADADAPRSGGGGVKPSPAALQLDAMATEVATAVAKADRVAAELAVLQRYSPVTAIRATLRNVVDFALHYTDWSNLTAFDLVDGVRCHQPTRTAWSAVQDYVTEVELANPLVQHVALLYDGYVVTGRRLPAFDVIYSWLRLHAFHQLKRTYAPDTRPLDFTSLAPVPVHPMRSRGGGGGGSGSGSGSVGHHHHRASTLTAAAAAATPPRSIPASPPSASAVAAAGASPARPPPAPPRGDTAGGTTSSGGAGSRSIASIRAPAASSATAAAAAAAGGGASGGTVDVRRRASSMSSTSSAADPMLGSIPRQLAAVGLGGSGIGLGAAPTTPAADGSGATGTPSPLPAAKGGEASLAAAAAGSKRGSGINSAALMRPSIAASSQALQMRAAEAAAAVAPWSAMLDGRALQSLLDDACRRAVGAVKTTAAAIATTTTAATTTEATLQRWGGILTATCLGVDRWASGGGSSSSGSGALPAVPTYLQPTATAAASSAPLSSSPGRGGSSGDGGGGSSSMAAFYRGPKPSILAVPALPAAAASQACLKAVVTVPADWPVLFLPYVTVDYLASLRTIAPPPPTPTEADSSALEIVKAGAEEAATPTVVAPTPVYPMVSAGGAVVGMRRIEVVVSTPAVGPPPARRIGPGAAGSSAGIIMTATGGAAGIVEGAIPGARGGPGGAAGGGSSPTIRPRAGSDVAMLTPILNGSHIFVPPVWAYNVNAAFPSHRLLWYQHGLITLICYVDANALMAAEKPALPPSSGAATPSPAAAAAGASSSPPQQQYHVVLDVPAAPLQSLALRLRELSSRFIAAVEHQLSESVDLVSSAFTSAGVEATKHVHAESLEQVFTVHGFTTVARRPGKGRDASGAPISQAAPMSSALFCGETPRHLHATLLDAQAEVAMVAHPGRSELQFGVPDALWAGPVAAGGAAAAASAVPRPLTELPFSPLLMQAMLVGSRAVAETRLAWKLRRRAEVERGADESLPPPTFIPSHLSPFACLDLTSVAPHTEEHLLATRYNGGVVLRRSASHRVAFVFDGSTPLLTDMQRRANELATRYVVK